MVFTIHLLASWVVGLSNVFILVLYLPFITRSPALTPDDIDQFMAIFMAIEQCTPAPKAILQQPRPRGTLGALECGAEAWGGCYGR